MQVQGMLRAVPVPGTCRIGPGGSPLVNCDSAVAGGGGRRPVTRLLRVEDAPPTHRRTRPLGRACDTCCFREADTGSV